MDVIREKWEDILYTVKVEHELSDISFKTWLKPLQVSQCQRSCRHDSGSV